MVHFVRKILMDRIKDQNMNFYLETPSTSNNVITFTLSGYKSEQKLGTLYWRVDEGFFKSYKKETNARGENWLDTCTCTALKSKFDT